jgi:hypothetical protein
VCDRRKLRVNVGKSKVMRCSRNDDVSRISVLLDGELSMEVQWVKCLGLHVEKDELVETKVKSRVKEGCKVFGALKRVMKCRTLGMKKKIGLYEGAVISTVLYMGLRGESVREKKVECL